MLHLQSGDGHVISHTSCINSVFKNTFVLLHCPPGYASLYTFGVTAEIASITEEYHYESLPSQCDKVPSASSCDMPTCHTPLE